MLYITYTFIVYGAAVNTRNSFPYKVFGELVASLRVKAGLAQQSDLAVLAQTTQQTISRWEAGGSRPRVKQMPLLASTLKADLDELLAAAGYTPQITVATFDQPFPIDALTPDSFERFCLYFLSNLHPTAQVHRVGGQGHTQDGLDVDAMFPDGTCFTFQCKRVQDFGPAKAHAAVKAHTRPAAKKYLLLTRPAASPQARQAVREYEDWDIWDREDVSRMIRQYLSKDQQLRLVDTFFRGQRLALLGEMEAGPWQTSAEFFEAFASEQRAFNHQWELIGRDDDVAALVNAVVNPKISATLLIGPGGAGKSRVLKQAIEVLERDHSDIMARFLSPTNEVTNLEDLGDRQKLLVIDDAHDRENLQLLFQYVATPANKATLLLSFRPYGLTHIKGQASTFALVGDCIAERRLNPLSLEQATQLATLVLTKFDGPVAAAKDIARLTLDCPLFTVIGAQVVSAEKLPLELVKNEDVFRSTLMGKFKDVIAGHVGSKTDAPLVKKLLNVLALIQPFHLEDRVIQHVAEQVEQLQLSDVSRLLRLLVEAGVIFKRGGKYRLSPDLLADYIIETACIGAEEKSTGYAERVFDAMPPGRIDHVVLNLGKLDWRLSNGDPSNSRLLDGIWSKLKPSSEYADPHISAVIAVAYYQPQRALEFTETLIRTGSYLRDLPNLIKNVAYNLECLGHACECLWQLGKTDDRALNSNPGHAVRILSELCAVEQNKPLGYNEIVVNFALSLIEDDASWGNVYTPLDILKGIARTEGHTTTSNGRAISFGPFLVRAGAVSGMRAKVVDATIGLLTHSNTRIAVLAAKFLHDCLQYPMGMFNVQITPEERDAWTDEFVTTLEKVEQTIKTKSLDPLVLIEIIRSISWHAKYAQNRTTPIAQRVTALAPTSLEFRTTLAFIDGYGHLLDHSDFEERQRRCTEFLESLKEDLLSSYSDVEQLRSFLDQILLKIRKTYPDGSHSQHILVWNLIRASYPLAKIVAEDALLNATSMTAQFAGISLSRVLLEEHEYGIGLARKFFDTGTPVLQAAVGRAYCNFEDATNGYGEDDLRLIRDALSSTDQWVVQNGIEAVRSVARNNTRLAVDLLKCVDLNISTGVADDVCILFQRDEMIPFRSLTSDDIEHFLACLKPTPHLDGYWVETFLSRVSKHHARLGAEFFMERVELAARASDWTLRPCNHGPYVHIPLRFRESEDFALVLRQISQWITAWPDGDFQFEYYAGELFDTMFSPMDDELLTFLEDWIDAGSARDIRLISRIFSDGQSTFVFENRAFVTRFLDKANQYGVEVLETAIGALFSSVISGVISSHPGEPAPRDVNIRDEAEKALQVIPRFSPARRLYENLKKHAEERIEQSIRERETFEDE